jgi:Zn-dependent membrane protease YugP
LIIPGILLAMAAQAKVNNAFSRYSRIESSGRWTGAAAARRILDENGLQDVQIRAIEVSMTDHYDPRSRTLSLSQTVHSSTSLAALGVAAHEVGHALQHSQGYAPISIRSALVPVANIGSYAAWPLLILGLVLSVPSLVWVGIFAFAFAVLFQIVTLPVEYNASHRALELLRSGGFLAEEEVQGARKVLSAAAMTYLAATLMAILQLLRLILLANGGRRRSD